MAGDVEGGTDADGLPGDSWLVEVVMTCSARVEVACADFLTTADQVGDVVHSELSTGEL